MILEWARPAVDDLRGIEGWLEEKATPAFAVRTLVAIRARALFLENFPHGGRPHADGTRVLVVYGTPYLIRYRILESVAQVLRIHHAREDWNVEV